MRTKNHTEGFTARIGQFARQEPIILIGILLFIAIGISWLLTSFELWPEAVEPTPTGTAIFEKGDPMTWIGMKVMPVDRSIRKDFKIPRRIKGIFVLDEGLDIAKKYGVKAGDVILSIGRKPVYDINTFVGVADNVKFMDGILLEIYRDGQPTYITIPFEYQYGPLMGPNQGTWQMGSPVVGPAFPYGPIYNANNNQAQTQTPNL